jgi:hypothetical protein
MFFHQQLKAALRALVLHKTRKERLVLACYFLRFRQRGLERLDKSKFVEVTKKVVNRPSVSKPKIESHT